MQQQRTETASDKSERLEQTGLSPKKLTSSTAAVPSATVLSIELPASRTTVTDEARTTAKDKKKILDLDLKSGYRLVMSCHLGQDEP
jgi:hypothetical protein